MASGVPSSLSRSTRERPAKPALSEDAVVEAALAVLQAEGLEAVTMRRVAGALDTGAASLYVYVRGRDELRQLMLERVLSRARLPEPDPARWREQVHAMLQDALDELAAYPGLAQCAVAEPLMSERVLRYADRLLGLVLLGGAAPQAAAWTCDALNMLLTMTAIEADVRRDRGSSEAALAEHVGGVFRDLDPERFPHLTRHASSMLHGDAAERLHFAIDALLDGALARGEVPGPRDSP